ncbi:hypothetical protein GJV85_02170 [Sulfurimonas aquatica]|uniref:Uncharacterized protein n=1 Tax=Sulfurimonas aquatica TaxID=2672570 RepID=A0A975AYS1_9BACT|nr:hypothetical protein [Sulfurimonas aquatica]QSZ40968.1 hypothetical protein GJV85_02170 [Sulfurimonas aquatica]
MDGNMLITYKILCSGDMNQKISLEQLLSNEKVLKVIKSEFAKGHRNISLGSKESASLYIETTKELYTLEVQKDDFADLLTLAEEDANNRKLLKKECSRVELVDIETI